MTIVQHPDRRGATRFEKALQVRFTVNDGPEQLSDTINFTSRSVAIRSNCKVHKDDKIVAMVDDLPEIKGSVIRVFDEGFAIILSDSSLALIAHAGADMPEHNEGNSANITDSRILSEVFRGDAPAPAWVQITTTRNNLANGEIHRLSIVTTSDLDVENIRNVWVSINETRWTARMLQSKHENNQALLVVPLNDWQLRMAAKYGMTITIINSDLTPWQVCLPGQPIDDHVSSLDPEETALSA